MKYVSIDIETTGLNPETCQILEFAAVVDDLASQQPLVGLPRFQTYVRHELYQGESYALSMHPKIFKKLSSKVPDDDVVDACALYYKFQNFLTREGGYDGDATLPVNITVAGKNFANFDKRFLEKLPNSRMVKFNHRVLDPMMLFLSKDDKEPPGSAVCMERAGLAGAVAHTALEDALMVVQLIRIGLNRK